MSMFCGSLFVILFFFFWLLCCLFSFDLRILITSLWYLQILLLFNEWLIIGFLSRVKWRMSLVEQYCFSQPLDKVVRWFRWKIFFLSYPGSWVRQATLLYSRKFIFIVELNCRFIGMHPCLGSILKVFHNKIQCIL